MHARRLACPAMLLILLPGACSTAIDAPQTGRLELRVAPLNLEGVADACYTLTVTNAPGGAGEVVWTRAGICSTGHGDAAGSISYVGTCDASVATTNTVVLEMTSLDGPDGPLEFMNPCGGALTSPCQREAVCVANGDVPVVFDLVVMRPARQGFFDVAVSFADLFCSAKVDCSRDTPGGEAPIALLHPYDGGGRVPTVVVAFACTGGAGADTQLYFDDATLDCGGAITLLPLGGPAGNVYSLASPPPAPVLQLATYRGIEGLTDELGASYGKIYETVAVALDFDAVQSACTLSGALTAADGVLSPAHTTPAGSLYPILRVDLEIVASGGATAYSCTRSALGTTAADGLWGEYISGVPPEVFTYRVYDDGAGTAAIATHPVAVAVSASSLNFPQTQTSTQSAAQTLTLTATGSAALVVGAPVISGDFVVVSNGCTAPVAPAGTCAIDVAFAPSVAGTRSGALTLSHNGPRGPLVVGLSGEGLDQLVATVIELPTAISNGAPWSNWNLWTRLRITTDPTNNLVIVDAWYTATCPSSCIAPIGTYGAWVFPPTSGPVTARNTIAGYPSNVLISRSMPLEVGSWFMDGDVLDLRFDIAANGKATVVSAIDTSRSNQSYAGQLTISDTPQ